MQFPLAQFPLTGVWPMYMQVGEFRISWIISTVPLTQFLRNAGFFKTKIHAMREIGVVSAVFQRAVPEEAILMYWLSNLSERCYTMTISACPPQTQYDSSNCCSIHKKASFKILSRVVANENYLVRNSLLESQSF
jgi:hypothetical protein